MNWKFYGDSRSDIVVYIKWLSEPPKSNFLVYGPILTKVFSFKWKFTGEFKSNIVLYLKMSVWTTKAQFPCLWTDLNQFFSFNWKIVTSNNCLIIIYFGVMILCKINFDTIWYSVIFVTSLYSSDLISWTSFFLMLSILFHRKLTKKSKLYSSLYLLGIWLHKFEL